MVKILSSILFVIGLSFLVVACGNSMDSDTKRVAKLICEAQELMQNPDDMAKASKLSQEAQQLQSKLNEKYKSQEEKSAFAAAVARETEKCN